ncbi:MAG: hypothetical protein E7301_00800 [Butyrivibrio sp.]|nr:hypothetical protein [Butyrivibrio sp.]
MDKLLTIIAEKEKNIYRIYLITIAIFFGFVSIIMFYTGIRTNDYEPVPAYISDITSREVLRKQGIRTEYDYIVHWIYDGKEYHRTLRNQITEPDQNLSEVWINEDNTDMSVSESDSSLKSAVSLILIAIICFLLWLQLFRKAKKIIPVSKEKWESMYTLTKLVLIIGLVGVIYSFIVANSYGNFEIITKEAMTIFSFFLLIVYVIFIWANRVIRKHI